MPLTSLGEGGGSKKDSWKPLCTNKKQKKDLAASNVSIFGGGGSSARREAEFSKLEESREESLSSCPLWASLKEGGGAVLPRAAWRPLPSTCSGGRGGGGATGQVGGLGRSCSAPGPEVCAKLRQFLGRHFNCGFQQDRGPLAALRVGVGGRESRLPFLSRLFPPLPRYPPPPPPPSPFGVGGGLFSGLFPQGLPGSSHPVGGGCLCRRSRAGGSPLA